MNRPTEQVTIELPPTTTAPVTPSSPLAEVQFAPGGFRTDPDFDTSFEQPDTNRSDPQSGPPTPLPKRPKGRIAIGMMLLVLCALVGHSLWEMFFRYGAYGLVIGHVAEVAAPWEGIVTQSHASEIN